MAKLKKKMCKYAKDGLKENEASLIAEILHPRYVCRKCLRVSTDKKLLCDPVKLEE